MNKKQEKRKSKFGLYSWCLRMFNFMYLLITKIVWARCYRLLPYCAYLKSNFLVHWGTFLLWLYSNYGSVPQPDGILYCTKMFPVIVAGKAECGIKGEELAAILWQKFNLFGWNTTCIQYGQCQVLVHIDSIGNSTAFQRPDQHPAGLMRHLSHSV